MCRRGEVVDQAARGQYSAHLLGSRAVEIVQQHAALAPPGQPLFLYVAFQSVHAPLQVGTLKWLSRENYEN